MTEAKAEDPPRKPCPFSVGQPILDTYSGLHAVVTELTEKGFKYRMERNVNLGARIGYYNEGECYELGYGLWRALTEDEAAALVSSMWEGQ